MKNGQDPAFGPGTALNGDCATRAADRAVNELQHGRFIAVCDGDNTFVVTAMETMDAAALDRFRMLTADAALLLTTERAAALRTSVVGPIRIPLGELDADALRRLAGLDASVEALRDVPAAPWSGSPELLAAAFRLAKRARLAPALIGADFTGGFVDASVDSFPLAAIEPVARAPIPELHRIGTGRVPLLEAEASFVTLFRDPVSAAEHVAVTIGDPQPRSRDGVPVRIHSACLTGDVLGSLRCDCGEQLRTAVRRIAEFGGGVLLYLDQEGRGIGLANKLRAYALQDVGLDTLDADRHLGFRADERSYGPAAAILNDLGIGRIRLLTNNPQKITALRDLGIDVSGRLPLLTESNVHNERYLRAKRERAGHLNEA